MKQAAKARRVGVAGALAALALAALAVAVPVGIAAAGGNGGGGGPAGPATVTVHVTAHHSRFTPSTVEVAPGATVRFVIRNLDPIDHEFILGGPGVHQHHEVGRDAHHHGDAQGEISVPAGTTATTTWTAPAAPGPVVYACHLPGHFAYGMAGVVRVGQERAGYDQKVTSSQTRDQNPGSSWDSGASVRKRGAAGEGRMA